MFALLASLSSPPTVLGEVVVYEGQVFPELDGWQRDGTLDCERWIEDARFFHNVDLGVWAPPPGGEQDRYRHSLSQFIGTEQLFVEWRMMTDGDSAEIPGVAPASLVTGISNGVRYHFTISRDVVRLIRDNFLPIVYAEIESDVLHTHRLELYGDELYVWYIDGAVIDSGAPEGAFPTSDVNINFRAKSWFLENTTQWDYVRFGVLPQEGGGDFNSDDQVNSDDLYFFQECLSDPNAGSWPGCAWADIDSDGDTDCDDWALFLAAWTDPADPPGMPQCAIPPDFDGDGHVGAFDLAILLGSWGPCPDPPANCSADLDGDGEVGASDLAILLGSWG